MDEDVTTIHITETLSSFMIINLLEEYPNLERITCAPSVYERTSKKYIDALRQLDIEVVKEYHWGASRQPCDYEEELLKLANEGYKAAEIAEMLDITVNRVYYLLRRNKTKLDTNTKKYDYEEVKSLRESGLKPREISEKLNIPLRSVYYILNNK
ncbi:hypothetical protein [Methanobrevibacter millerae]|uniref:Uncharacterized protein n=1 Tax=Methanobrevibacter millerae TaxID=230361 RepID=A0A1G5XKV8_9EURY|nr:hypothetical protein [Methanobrevibacter millerae]SDA70574.1 hypothetical protein SAMN02910315_02317 [Methanobrevibacter millerae]